MFVLLQTLRSCLYKYPNTSAHMKSTSNIELCWVTNVEPSVPSGEVTSESVQMSNEMLYKQSVISAGRLSCISNE